MRPPNATLDSSVAASYCLNDSTSVTENISGVPVSDEKWAWKSCSSMRSYDIIAEGWTGYEGGSSICSYVPYGARI